MLNTLKKVVPDSLRHEVVHKLPATLRHRLVDGYIERQMSAFKIFLDTHGDKWLENLPAWRSTFEDSGSAESLITEYWRTIDLDGNSPAAYAQSAIEYDVQWLRANADKLLPNKGTVLDFGCNAGRVLHRFVEDGYQGVGVEISEKAVSMGKKTFPSLQKATFWIDDGPAALKNVEQGSIDLVYSCSALRHVAPEKIDDVLAEFARIQPSYILTVEDEASSDHHSFPHDYRGKLRALGFVEKSKAYAIDLASYVNIGGIGTMFRVYARGTK
jgi:SAM-dependent methyltransferase